MSFPTSLSLSSIVPGTPSWKKRQKDFDLSKDYLKFDSIRLIFLYIF
jgi:hypothetical protein